MIKGDTIIESLRAASASKFENMSAGGRWVVEVTGGMNTPFEKWLRTISVASTRNAITLRGAQEKAFKDLLAGFKAKDAAKVKAAAAVLGGAAAPPKPPRSAPKPPKPRRSAPKPAAAGWPTFAGTVNTAQKRWNDAVARGSDPIAATVRRIGAIKTIPKLDEIAETMFDYLRAGLAAHDHGALSDAYLDRRSKLQGEQRAASKPKPRPSKPKRSATKRSATKPPASPKTKPPATRKPRKKPATPRRRPAAAPARAAATAVVQEAVVNAAKIAAKGTATSGKKKVRFDITLTPSK